MRKLKFSFLRFLDFSFDFLDRNKFSLCEWKSKRLRKVIVYFFFNYAWISIKRFILRGQYFQIYSLKTIFKQKKWYVVIIFFYSVCLHSKNLSSLKTIKSLSNRWGRGAVHYGKTCLFTEIQIITFWFETLNRGSLLVFFSNFFFHKTIPYSYRIYS